MLTSLHVRGYRSLEALNLPLRPLTVVTGGNGTGKSNLYRALQLLALAAQGELARSLAHEGGMTSVLWAGPRRRTGRSAPAVRVHLELRSEAFGYLLTLGLPPPGESLFRFDPEVKEERAWLGPRDRPSTRFLERDHASARLRTAEDDWIDYPGALLPAESVLAQVQDARRFPDLAALRRTLSAWRFYHQFRTDAGSPLRAPQIGTRTPTLASDGADLAAALATIQETGDAVALDRAIAGLLPGGRLTITAVDGWFEPLLHVPGLPRPLRARELSDGQLRYLAFVAALLSPRPAPLIACNEPEASLHPELFPALAGLLVAASARQQVWVTTHSEVLATALAQATDDVTPVRLELREGATRVAGQGLIWNAADDDASD